MKIEGWDETDQPRNLAFGIAGPMVMVSVDGEQFGITVEEAMDMVAAIYECAVRAKMNQIVSSN